MLIFPANAGARDQAEAMAVSAIATGYAQLSPQGQASAFEVIASNGEGGPSSLVRQQVIAGALGAVAAVALVRFALGWK